MQDVLAEKITEKLERAMAREYGELLAEHEKDYREFYDRVALSLPEKEENAALPTDERLQRIISGGTDEGLAKLLFDYGRYLLIGCSRPGIFRRRCRASGTRISWRRGTANIRSTSIRK